MEWYKEWFDSTYYHTLYNKRNSSEAEYLIDNLLKEFKPNKNAFFLDLCCGSGRHSIYLNKKGFFVDGFDLSKKSLATAKEYQKKNLNFYLKDMRSFNIKNKYDFALNLFTSFGYFEAEEDNKKVFQNVNNSIKKGGYFIIDFFNAEKVIKELKKKEVQKINDVTFEIQKKYDTNFVYKEISITDQRNKYNFIEKVRLLDTEKFIDYAKHTNMKLLTTFGDYHLNKYNSKISPRLLLIFQKN